MIWTLEQVFSTLLSLTHDNKYQAIFNASNNVLPRTMYYLELDLPLDLIFESQWGLAGAFTGAISPGLKGSQFDQFESREPSLNSRVIIQDQSHPLFFAAIHLLGSCRLPPMLLTPPCWISLHLVRAWWPCISLNLVRLCSTNPESASTRQFGLLLPEDNLTLLD